MLRCLLLSLLLLAGAAHAAPHTVILVRHAEKASEPGGDPALSAAGQARAVALADALADAGIGSIVVSQFRRTRDTAAPLAERLGIAAQVIEAGGDTAAHVAAVAGAIRASTGVVLVVGHSNTVPAIVAALGGPALPDLCESQFDRVFVLSEPFQRARLQRWRYGAAGSDTSVSCG